MSKNNTFDPCNLSCSMRVNVKVKHIVYSYMKLTWILSKSRMTDQRPIYGFMFHVSILVSIHPNNFDYDFYFYLFYFKIKQVVGLTKSQKHYQQFCSSFWPLDATVYSMLKNVFYKCFAITCVFVSNAVSHFCSSHDFALHLGALLKSTFFCEYWLDAMVWC